MAGVSFPVSRSTGEALVVASPTARPQALATLATLGMACAECDDPYSAMAELCRRPMVYRAVILSLASVYTEELEIISAIKQRFQNIEVWLTHTDGRYSSLAEAMRLGADGLLADDGLHRIAGASAGPAPSVANNGGNSESAPPPASASEAKAPAIAPRQLQAPHSNEADGNGHDAPAHVAAVHAEAHHRTASAAPASLPSGPCGDGAFGEPVLTADELRALLQEQPPAADLGEKELL